jgi:hypothetical protein
MSPPARWLLAAGFAAVLPVLLPAEAPSLDAVLARTAAYVAAFERQLSGIVGEETYEQQETGGEHRTLKSDLLLVRPPGLGRWVEFRDVFEVDGKPVRDRRERLSELFQQPAESALEQARRIVNESSRFNVGTLLRTINSPLFPLHMLESSNQWRFRFARTAGDKAKAATDALPDSPLYRVSTEVWVIRFDERESPTLVQDPERHRDVFSHGRFWIEPDTGRVLMAAVSWAHPDVDAELTVSFQSEPLLGLLVPAEMRESYSDRRHRQGGKPARIDARATYGRFRPFQPSEAP